MADTPAPAVKNRGWTVTFAGTGINLALGILYTWSVISKGIPGRLGLDRDREVAGPTPSPAWSSA